MKFNKVKLKDISCGEGSYGIGASAVEYSEDLYKYLRITDISENGTINENEKIVLDIILKDPNITIAEMANQSNKSIRTINRIINSLKEKNLLKRMNSNKDGYWEVLK